MNRWIMTRWVFWMVVAFTAAALSGCAAIGLQGKTRYVTHIPEIPERLLAVCTIAPPPDRIAYLGADWPEKERLLTENTQAHLTNAALCNVGKAELRAWKQKQQALYAP